MNGIWEQLAGNIALVGCAVLIWSHSLVWLRRFLTGHEKTLLGIIAAGAAVGSIFLSVDVGPEGYVDLRYAVIAIAALFGGPISVIVAASAVIIVIFSFPAGAPVDGAIKIATVAAIGMACNFRMGRRAPNLSDVVLATIAIGTALTVAMFLPMVTKFHQPASVIPLDVALNCAAFIISGLIILKTQKSELERSILITAFSQAPDYLYIKDRNSRFVTVNQNMVRLHRRTTTDELVGLSDFDTMTAARAEELYYHEQQLMRTGTPLIDSLEQMDDRFYLASKVPVRDAEGRVIGLAGVTRDVTERWTLERELRESKDLLTYAMDGMSDGFAMFDRQGILLFCNEQYRNAFPLSSEARVIGANIRDILVRVVETGERMDVPSDGTEEWIEAVSAAVYHNKDEEIQLRNGDWRSLKTRLTENGTAMVLVSDITAMKQAENALRLSAEQMKSLAETDGLTGIVNRRAFDEAYEREAARSAKNNTPLSLLMIDIDWFKAFNDTYGHPAGDRCLRQVSQCLLDAVGRSTDIVARYGGEEFVALLPETPQDEAIVFAKRFMRRLSQENIEHSGSEYGHVTASIGVACAAGWMLRAESDRLVQVADAALYDAKAQGRNRILSRGGAAALKTG